MEGTGSAAEFLPPRLTLPALREAVQGCRGKTYVTNAVKHFKWEARGKRRIHAKPSWSEIAACQPWLEAEGASPWTRPSLRT